jgi:hypothetical protein
LKRTLENNPNIKGKFAENARKVGYLNRGRIRSAETRKKYSERSKSKWLDKDYARRCIQGLSLRPNELELRLQKLLDRLVPHEYKYTGDGSRIIAGKLPDFVNINGQRKIIELFGRNWHDPEEVPQRMACFKPYGWNCLVIWDDEFKDMETLKAKVVNFTSHDPTWIG